MTLSDLVSQIVTVVDLVVSTLRRSGLGVPFTVPVPKGARTVDVQMTMSSLDYRVIGPCASWNTIVFCTNKRLDGFTLAFNTEPIADGSVDGEVKLPLP